MLSNYTLFLGNSKCTWWDSNSHSARIQLRKRSQCFAASAIVTSGFLRQKLANSCPSGKTIRTRWSLIFISRAMRLWVSQQRSEPAAFSRSTSLPARSEQISSSVSSSEAKSSCTTRDPRSPHDISATYRSPGPKGGIWHLPEPWWPQATADPSLRNSTVWSSPAATWM